MNNIGHFRVAQSLCFKTRPSAKMNLYFHANKTHFSKQKGFALSPVLKVRVFDESLDYRILETSN